MTRACQVTLLPPRTESRCDRVLAEMAATPRVKVKPIYTPEGIFVSATLREKTLFFLTRAAARAQKNAKGNVQVSWGNVQGRTRGTR